MELLEGKYGNTVRYDNSPGLSEGDHSCKLYPPLALSKVSHPRPTETSTCFLSTCCRLLNVESHFVDIIAMDPFSIPPALRCTYTGDAGYDLALEAALVLSVVVAIFAPFVPSPYGRFADPRFGPACSARVGWWLMELPATVVFAAVFSWEYQGDLVPAVFAVIWALHYINRGWLQPFLMRPARGQPATFSALVVACGWLVTGLHAYLHARYICRLGGYTTAWLADPRFVSGCLVYYAALAANIHADAVTRSLRSQAEAAAGLRVYRIPQGGLFEFVSCPAYLTELLAWGGFAMATWSLAGVFILLVSAANLVPRALETHRWYGRTFKDYPLRRRALLPYIL